MSEVKRDDAELFDDSQLEGFEDEELDLEEEPQLDIDESDLEEFVGEDSEDSDLQLDLGDNGNGDLDIDLDESELEAFGTDEQTTDVGMPEISDADLIGDGDIAIPDDNTVDSTDNMSDTASENGNDIELDLDLGDDTQVADTSESDDNFEIKDESLSDIDRQIAELERQLKSDDSSNDESSIGADSDGSIIDNEALMGDSTDEYAIASRDYDLISPTGDIVVMSPEDNEEGFKLVYVDIKNIAVMGRIRENKGVDDLVKSIKSTGLLKPIDVAPTNVDGVYVLLNGYRRLLACAKAGKLRIPCVVNTMVATPDIPILEAMYNMSKSYSIKEMIEYIDYLEKEKGIMNASMIEYLLQMNSGDYTKLKDILNDNDDDIVSKLMNGQLSIADAFKKLEQRRKKESAEEKELKKATRVYEEDPDSGVQGIENSGETGNDDNAMSDEELDKLNLNANNLQDVEEEDLGQMIKDGNSIPGFKPHKQDPKYRERLDPTTRKSVLVRDNNTCQICGLISGMEFTEVLDVHHIHEVYLGGSDDINNLITACTVCHKLIHLYGRGELHMRPLEELSDVEQKRFKKVVGLGNVIRLDMRKKGMKVDELKKLDNTATIGRTKPGTGQEAG